MKKEIEPGDRALTPDVLAIVVSEAFLRTSFPQRSKPMKFVGIDLHKKTIVLCIVNQEKKVLQ